MFAAVGVEHCAGHLHEVCLVAIWVNNPTGSSLYVFIYLQTLQNDQTYFFLPTQRKAFDHNCSVNKTAYEMHGYAIYLHVGFQKKTSIFSV